MTDVSHFFKEAERTLLDGRYRVSEESPEAWSVFSRSSCLVRGSTDLASISRRMGVVFRREAAGFSSLGHLGIRGPLRPPSDPGEGAISDIEFILDGYLAALPD